MIPSQRRPAGESPAGRVCLVTGGTAGLGRPLARALADAGAHVHVGAGVGDHSAPGPERSAGDPERAPQDTSITVTDVDVTDRAALEAWIAAVHAEHGRIDVLIHNAVRMHGAADAEGMTVEQAQSAMRAGYDALVCSVRAVLPLMRSAGGGQIVAVGPGEGRMSGEGAAASCAAVKAAVEAYTEMLRSELAGSGSGIGVTLVRTDTAGNGFRMPRIADFLPSVSPEEAADAVVHAIRHRRPSVDVPGSLTLLHRGFKVAAAGVAKCEGLALRAIKKADANTYFLRAMSTIAPSVDRAAHRLTGGRVLVMPALLPSLMLTTTGSVSGRPRQVPLLCHPEADGSYLIVASNSGKPHHPAWSRNLLTTPQAAITRFGRTVKVTATLLDGSERTAAWDHMVKFWPPYEGYARSSGRNLRIFRLAPA
ncbi:SDR family NAD(P)-dependent oxidoreductase [Streptomyces klenkii]|uniref:SDR family NAD(P)-dependent oxidoreductase n=1 Tax=Streptomyces klenkii TaxID=1420899 RepID=A0A3B0C2H7_9ACTN|nr:SDR family NAD(P)-dependent oxidoreductase [Streptomyces klenkii]RKN77566.1 SDR family NAD(P)-dependent oxidoreductase [Streptomyces klenkii]